MKQLARNLRRNQTEAEKRLWRSFRDRQVCGFKFRRQHIIEPYIVDFVCIEKKLIVEIDGGQHAERVEADKERTSCLENKGYKVIRFWNNEVLGNTDAVLDVIFDILNETPHPNPLPSKGRGDK